MLDSLVKYSEIPSQKGFREIGTAGLVSYKLKKPATFRKPFSRKVIQ